MGGALKDSHRFLTLPATPKSLILKEKVRGEESERLFQLLLYIVFLSLLEKGTLTFLTFSLFCANP